MITYDAELSQAESNVEKFFYAKGYHSLTDEDRFVLEK
jgi:hypothetical protein